VVLKWLQSHKPEYRMHLMITSLEDASDRFPTLYDTILLPDTDESFIIVMPYLHSIAITDFDSVYEFLEFCLRLADVPFTYPSLSLPTHALIHRI
jgi:hypothetical protein